ncbi:hypothetical protein PG984_010672 [Apiospora sp. TS-2023a]
MVWKEFLLGESKNRIVSIHRSEPYLLPDTNLISPLLSVSQESRAAALKYYNTKLTVYVFIHESCCRYPSFPKGLLYVNMEKDHFKRIVIYGGIRILDISSEYLHFHNDFARHSPRCRFGALTESLPDTHLPLNKLPNYKETDFSSDPDDWTSESDDDTSYSDGNSSDADAKPTHEEPSNPADISELEDSDSEDDLD